ncbi:MAG TPA: GNAT family N-acetyltransferase [Catenuloplanes sp.]
MIGPLPRRATAADVGDVTAVIATAFHELEPGGWLVPDDREREKVFIEYFRIWVEHAERYGEIYTIDDGTAVAVWFPATGDPAPPPPDYEERLEAICGEHSDRFRIFDQLMDEHHPHQPHDYLAFLACLPAYQGTGLGSTLLRHRHRTLDERGIPAYLEASRARSRDLYLRHGYQPHGESYRLPDGPPLWPMWREPQPL